MSAFWSAWVTVITLAVILGCTWLLLATRKSQPHQEVTEETLGHEFDGIAEYDNPLPKWWFQMFIGTVVFGLVYLVLYPGLGNFQGLLGWTSHNQWEEEIQHAEEVYKPVFAKYASLPAEELLKPENASGLKMGQRMFANNCSVCHGSAATGAHGFPNLTDNDWVRYWVKKAYAMLRTTFYHSAEQRPMQKQLNAAKANSRHFVPLVTAPMLKVYLS